MGTHALRMGRTMSYTSPDGASHPNSFWCLNLLTTEIGERGLRLRFIGYHNAASYDADKQPIAGAIREYLLTDTNFDAAINRATEGVTGTPISVEILNMAWQVAEDTKDIGLPPSQGQPDTRTSFFEDAVAVPLD